MATSRPSHRSNLRRRASNRLTLAAIVIVSVILCSILLVIFTIPGGLSSSTHRNVDSPLFPGLVSVRDYFIGLVFGHPPKRRQRGSPSTGVPEFTVNKYHKHIVARFNVTTTKEASALNKVIDTMFLDVWAATPQYVDVRVRKFDFDAVLGLLPSSLVDSHQRIIPDLVAASAATYPAPGSNNIPDLSISNSRPSRLSSLSKDIDNMFFQDYQPLSVVVPWMRLLQAMFPDLVEVIKIGTSYEGRDINGLRIGIRNKNLPSNDDDDPRRKAIIITGGVHAREWISTTSVNYAAWSMVTSYNKDSIITKMLQTFDTIFIPALNPDGVEYTWNTDRLWRKSRQHTNLRWCRGLDLDRAFGYQWTAKSDPCSESYGGDEPFEAVEALQFAEWAKNEATTNNIKFVGMLDLHSYSQQVLFPFSYTCNIEPPNLENLEELGIGLVKAIRLTSGESYSLASACEGVTAGEREPGTDAPRVEAGGGSAMDWFYHELGIRFNYQIKLRDTGNYGFLLPKEQIVPTGEEVFHAMKYFGDFLMGNNGIESLYEGEEGRAGEKIEIEIDELELR
ncbi:putative zinc carboxypeptidase protein [Zalerion maritima]|uniref:Inactive metallocarboxypeptidase ECM14 n=1 Tax=Zalerion maritima TaxID=339359 RepID=A0AAD5WRK0_9PEZI|nr:putative zinc carboxypeptidase protein [Zalerion maritima]